MQVGSENKTKMYAAIALGAVAVLLLGNWVFNSGGSPQAATVTPTEVTATPSARTAARRGKKGEKTHKPERSIDPTLRYDWLKASEETEYKGNGRNIFLAQMEIPKIVTSVHVRPKSTPPPPPPQPSGPPPPPPIDLKFFGFASRPGEAKRVFLSQGEDVFVAGEGEIVDRRYKILRISAASVEVEDVLNNNRQEIFLSQQGG